LRATSRTNARTNDSPWIARRAPIPFANSCTIVPVTKAARMYDTSA
jgi:hypothetical protein